MLRCVNGLKINADVKMVTASQIETNLLRVEKNKSSCSEHWYRFYIRRNASDQNADRLPEPKIIASN